MTKGKEPMVYMRFRLPVEMADKMQEYANRLGGKRGDLSIVYRDAIKMRIDYLEHRLICKKAAPALPTDEPEFART